MFENSNSKIQTSMKRVGVTLYLRSAVILAALLQGVFPGEDYRYQASEVIRFSWIVILFLALISCIALLGSLGVLTCCNRGCAARPSLSAPFFVKNSPLQFPWFVGFIFAAVGTGFVIRGFWDGVDANGYALLSVGLGLLAGCRVVIILFRRRFVVAG